MSTLKKSRLSTQPSNFVLIFTWHVKRIMWNRKYILLRELQFNDEFLYKVYHKLPLDVFKYLIKFIPRILITNSANTNTKFMTVYAMNYNIIRFVSGLHYPYI